MRTTALVLGAGRCFSVQLSVHQEPVTKHHFDRYFGFVGLSLHQNILLRSNLIQLYATNQQTWVITDQLVDLLLL